jgi:hypothetical protein
LGEILLSYYYICVLTLPVSSYYLCPHTCVLILLCIKVLRLWAKYSCPTTIYVSSYYLCPHTTCVLILPVSSYSYVLRYYYFGRNTLVILLCICVLMLYISSLIYIQVVQLTAEYSRHTTTYVSSYYLCPHTPIYTGGATNGGILSASRQLRAQRMMQGMHI